jgi:hypothetical protein
MSTSGLGIVWKCDSKAAQEAEGLWFMMHSEFPDDPNLQAAVVNYLDESGTGDESKFLVVGGPVFRKAEFVTISGEWNSMLRYNSIVPPFKMRDFVRPHGRYCGMLPEMKIALFTAVAGLINKYKVYSLDVAVEKASFDARLDERVKKRLVGPYAMAFLITAMRNCLIARRQDYHKRIAYLADEQSKSWTEQVHDARRLIRQWEADSKYQANMGSVTFDTDSHVPALQAADAVAWVARRVLDYGTLDKEFAPLADIISPHVERPGSTSIGHLSYVVSSEVIGLLAAQIDGWLSSNGDLPDSLTAFVPAIGESFL